MRFYNAQRYYLQAVSCLHAKDLLDVTSLNIVIQADLVDVGLFLVRKMKRRDEEVHVLALQSMPKQILKIKFIQLNFQTKNFYFFVQGRKTFSCRTAATFQIAQQTV